MPAKVHHAPADAPPHPRLIAGLGAAAAHPNARLRLETVLALAGIGRSTLYERVKHGQFPAPLHDGRAVRWLARDIHAWLDKQAGEAA